MKKYYYRSRQYMLSKIQPLIPWRIPKFISGAGSIYRIPRIIKQDGVKKVLIITTSGFIKRGSLSELFDEFEKENILYTIFDNVLPDPSIECIEDAVKVYRKEACEAIVAIGGGSVMDCAKVVGARIVKPAKSVIQMTGLFKIRKELPPLYAVPTTAGTGSEVTVAAVITDSSTHYKYAVSDTCLIPKYAILDPQLTCGLPQNLTADTGMDALTHAVEAYINKFASKESKKYALDAVKLIFNNLTKVYEDGNNLELRENMLMGSYYAGLAFTKAYVGYVHAIAHGLGGLYGVPHGHANAVILPVVLQAYGEAIHKELAELADAVGISGKTQQEKSRNFISAINQMNQSMGIQNKLNVVKKEDIPEIIRRAMKEANPAYPVPVIWNEKQLRSVIELL
ncbi:iron-containing alcohol dehydrogenase [[Clostridium] fimetarium]|uniref:Alcohol dehydrogenase, class IV n=1 Tax=[Clostridium] fimetarium TaxID=99656 RepID=A0A1I0N4Q6_9FIRM|nr:iron-containing alcohol dehydrogenase [[Clostridium] fimetarium]SEV95840.1 Alcohol dehydrogenase, class IV [[Clostridium] fimetarium]